MCPLIYECPNVLLIYWNINLKLQQVLQVKYFRSKTFIWQKRLWNLFQSEHPFFILNIKWIWIWGRYRGDGFPKSSSMLRSGWSRPFSISLIWGSVLITLVTLICCPPSLNPSISPSPPTGRGIPVPDGAAFLLFQPRLHLPTLTPAKDTTSTTTLFPPILPQAQLMQTI